MNFDTFKNRLDKTLANMNFLSTYNKEKIQNHYQLIFDTANITKQTDGSEEILDKNELKIAQDLFVKLVSLISSGCDIRNLIKQYSTKQTEQPTENSTQFSISEIENNEEITPETVPFFTNVNNKTKEYLSNDSTYQSYKLQYGKLKAQMTEIETKYGMAITGNIPNDIREEFKITNNDDEDKYSDYKLNKKLFSRQLENYEKIMANWQDGPYQDYYRRETKEFHNVERITLKNGQRAWKSDEGIFFPYRDGLIGGQRVPEELL